MTWVFAVCGADEHIETLNFSLPFLRRATKHSIVVITDTARNTLAIEHDHVIDVRLPEHLTNHQAAILLKTGAFEHLDPEGEYCYLDTDIIATGPKVDEIFHFKKSPVTFCTDHCKMRRFAPTAVHAPDADELKKRQKEFSEVMKKAEDSLPNSPRLKELKVLLERWFYTDQYKNRGVDDAMFRAFDRFQRRVAGPGKKQGLAAKLVLPLWRFPLKMYYKYLRGKNFYWDENKMLKLDNLSAYFKAHGFRLDHRTGFWHDLNGPLVYDPFELIKAVEASSAYRWDAKRREWRDDKGEPVFTPIESDRLGELILEKFGVQITEKDWQHWNGGVFLFGKDSHDFLRTWRDWTLEIFKDPQWKVRDQGTLIATCWKFGLQNHPTLPLEFNFLADFYHPTMVYKGDFTFDVSSSRRNVQPALLHIYHHWGDKEWPVWQDVEKRRP